MSHELTMSPMEALSKLKDGNAHFVQNNLTHNNHVDEARRQELTKGQAPYATVLACSDSRTPPEHIFDAGLGDLFICRNAGNLIDEVTLGSIEYAAAHTGCPLVCVMGHDNCGAVGATVAVAKNLDLHETHNIDDIVRRLLPAVLATREGQSDEKAWIDAAAKKNVDNVCQHIVQRSPLLKEKVAKGLFKVVGAWYDLASGKVEFIE